MKINDKSIRGIFLYDEDAIFESGDFVVEGKFMYVCKAESIAGVRPSEDPDSYYIYGGGEVASLKEFSEFAKGTALNNGDKLVSVNSLTQILNSYMSGFNEAGVIDNTISDNGNIFLSKFFERSAIETSISSDIEYSNPLDTIMAEPALNNTVFSVPRNLGAIMTIMGTSEYSETPYVILRQYTYLDSTNSLDLEEAEYVVGSYIRVQELVDPETGLSKFRYMIIRNNSYDGNFSSWTSTNINESFTSQVDTVMSYYQAQVNKLDRERLSLFNSFRFKTLQPSNNTVTIPSALVGKSNIFVTLSFSLKENTSALTSINDITVCLDDLSSNTAVKYNIFTGTQAALTYSSGVINVSYPVKNSTGDVITVQNAYYRQSYEDYIEADATAGGSVAVSKLSTDLEDDVFTLSCNPDADNIGTGATEFSNNNPMTFLVTGAIKWGDSSDRIYSYDYVNFYFSTSEICDSEFHEGVAYLSNKQYPCSKTPPYLLSHQRGRMTLSLTPSSFSNSGTIDTITMRALNSDPSTWEAYYNEGDQQGGRSNWTYQGMGISSVRRILG